MHLKLLWKNKIKVMAELEILNIKINEDYTIDLVGMENSGYSWVRDNETTDIVEITHQYIVPTNLVPGAKGTERFTFKGTKTGVVTIEFKQIRSWDKDQPPIAIRTFQINVI